MRPAALRRQTWIHSALALALARLPAPQEERIGGLALREAAASFADLAAACARDGGQLWGLELCGPVLLVDPLTRRVVANQPDAEGRLVARDGVHVGTLPPDRPLANAPVEWAGVRWAMAVVSFLGETSAERVALLAHECFHRVQPQLGLYAFGNENAHLDQLEGRVWLQLEWNALQFALASAGEARQAAIQDALDFRAARRAHFPGAAECENPLELREGLANYTGLRLTGRSGADVVGYCSAWRAKEENFNRSFAYLSGPLYGYLLDDASMDWRRGLSAASDLGALLAVAGGIRPSAERAGARAASHGDEALRTAEEARERLRLERLAAWRKTLIDGPVLVLDLAQVTAATMDTRKTFPFEPGRIVFTARHLTARFGTLEITDGAILEDSTTRVGRVSLLDAADDHLSGPGWRLVLAPGWRLEPGERAGDVCVRPEP